MDELPFHFRERIYTFLHDWRHDYDLCIKYIQNFLKDSNEPYYFFKKSQKEHRLMLFTGYILSEGGFLNYEFRPVHLTHWKDFYVLNYTKAILELVPRKI
jgi:hypothetical protein